MSLSPPPSSGPSPFTQTDSVDLSSFSSIFASKSEMNAPPAPTGSPPPGSLLASISSAMSAAHASEQSSTLSTSTVTGQSSTSGVAAAASTSASVSKQTASVSSATGTSATSGSGAITPSSAANNASANDLQREQSTMSSSAKQAAVAVPIVVVVLAIIAIIFFCMRRRRKRRQNTEDVVEKQAPAGGRKKKKWTRHLRVFSFDTELLMGGRYSSTNSIRSRQTGSVRSSNRSQHNDSTSIHSIEEVAPPYRDAIHTNQPSISQVMAAASGGAAAAGVTRSASSATAPPPYGAAAARQPAPLAQPSNRNPFADSPPVSPVDGSPFNDPPGTTPVISRNSSIYQAGRDDASSIGGISDAASIREATLARNASVISGGRVIQNVSRNSQ